MLLKVLNKYDKLSEIRAFDQMGKNVHTLSKSILCLFFIIKESLILDVICWLHLWEEILGAIGMKKGTLEQHQNNLLRKISKIGWFTLLMMLYKSILNNMVNFSQEISWALMSYINIWRILIQKSISIKKSIPKWWN